MPENAGRKEDSYDTGESQFHPLFIAHPVCIFLSIGISPLASFADVLMMKPAHLVVPLALGLTLSLSSLAQDEVKGEVIPGSINEWQAEGKPYTYNQKTVFDYLDGGAEVYLAYGM